MVLCRASHQVWSPQPAFIPAAVLLRDPHGDSSVYPVSFHCCTVLFIPFLLTGIRFVSSVFSVTLDWAGISEWTSEAQGIHALDFTRDGKDYVPPVHTCPVVSDPPVFPWRSPPVVCSDLKRSASLLCVKWRLAVLVLIPGCPVRLTVSSRA